MPQILKTCKDVVLFRICQNAWERPIHLNQVEIYDADDINRALTGIAQQSSRHHHDGSAEAMQCIDGNRYQYPNHTAHEQGEQWWSVSFKEPIPAVRSFSLYNVNTYWDGLPKCFRLEFARVEMWDVHNELVYSHVITVQDDPELFMEETGHSKTWTLDPDFEFVGSQQPVEAGFVCV